MAAPDSTKLQANFKLPDGTLINIYATSQAELEAQLTTVQDLAELIKSTSLALGGAGNVAYATQAFAAKPVVDTPPFNNAPASTGGAQEVRDKYGNLWIYNHPQAPECARGKMVLKHGTAQATGKPYKGWFDPAAGPNWAGPKVAKEEQFQTVWA
jgi:hypothetical protein